MRGSRILVLCLLLAQGGAAAQPIVIGYTNCLAVPSYSQSLMGEIAQLKWYFTHASVGVNLMEGIDSLHATNASFYRLRRNAAGDIPPVQTEAGVIYENDRGNPPWWQKFDWFQSNIGDGWGPAVNVAMNKLCFIDQAAILDWCLDYMTTLESGFPETMFVYMTMPLTVYEDGANYTRNVYNDELRDWCRTNNRVLFDIADVESHDAAGVPVTYIHNGRVCQRLYEGYAIDEGHLNGEGCRLAAKAFYALAAALLAVDRDGDGLSDGRELLAGTRYADAQSVFKFRPAIRPSPGNLVLEWNSASNRLYTLQRSTGGSPMGFTNLLVDVPGSPPLNTYTTAPPTAAGSFFYRVSVRQ